MPIGATDVSDFTLGNALKVGANEVINSIIKWPL